MKLPVIRFHLLIDNSVFLPITIRFFESSNKFVFVIFNFPSFLDII